MSRSETEGLVLWARGGFYRVLLQDSCELNSCELNSYELNSYELNCRLRGKLKRQRSQADGTGGVFAGDRVRISLQDQDEEGCSAMVEEVLPRKNFLPRPRIANIGLSLAVLAAKDPMYDLLLLDKILLVAAHYDIVPAICFNKADIAGPELAGVLAIYRQAGFAAVAVSAYTGQGMDELQELLKGHVSVLAGPSGVGKSSLLNILLPQLNAPVGDISARLQRGKHTTRHVSLLPLPQGGLAADAPGFSLLELPEDLEAERLPLLYPEFRELAAGCRFLGCLHQNEPACKVKEALKEGRVDAGRYERYLRFLSEIQEREIKY